jgi:hypothetical protein
LRLAYNPVNDEFGIILYGSDKVITVDGQTWEITGTTNYSAYETPVQIRYDQEGKSLVLTQGGTNSPGYLIRDMEDFVSLPDVASFFDYCDVTGTAAACMPGHDFITVVEYNLNTAPPVADFAADVTSIQVGDTVAFTDLSANMPTSWEWSFEGGTPGVSTEQNPVVLYETSGVFDVTLTASNAFGSDTKTIDDYIHVDSITFAGNGVMPVTVRVYPNPVSDQLFISVNRNIEGGAGITLFDAGGKLLFAKKLTGKENTLDVENLMPGTYFLRFRIKGETHTIKIFKN